jgi:hypothetical protein
MRSSQVNFIKPGSPSPPELPVESRWPKFCPQENKVMVITEKLTSSAWPESDNLDFMAEEFFGPNPYL